MSTIFGLMPFVDSYNISPSRRAWTLDGLWPTRSLKTFGRRINLNVNHYNGKPESDMTAYRLKLQKVPATDVDFISIENEEDLKPDRVNYIRQLATAVSLFPKVTNGGFTMSLAYWYINQNSWDTGFYSACIFDKTGYKEGKYNTLIADTQLELDAMILMNIFAVNVHIYIGDTLQVEPNIRMLKFAQQFTGKAIVSNESGYRKDVELLRYLPYIARELNMPWMTLYNGDGKTGHAMPISETDYLNAIK